MTQEQLERAATEVLCAMERGVALDQTPTGRYYLSSGASSVEVASEVIEWLVERDYVSAPYKLPRLQ